MSAPFTRSHSGASALAACLFLAPALAGAAPSPQAPVRITAIFGLSGRYAILGDAQRNALELAQKQINAAGGIDGRMLEISILDDEGKADVAEQLATGAVGKTVGIIGSNSTAASAAIARVATASGIPMIFTTPSAELWKTPHGVAKYVYETTPANEVEAPALLTFVKNRLHAQKIGIIYDENPYGSQGSGVVAALAPQMGMTVVAREAYPSIGTDFTAQLQRIKDAGAQAMLIWGAASAPPLIVRQARALGMSFPIVGSTGIVSQQFLKIAGAQGEGVYSDTNLNFTHPNAFQKSFLASYRAAYRESPTNFAAFAYDAVQLFAYAVRAGGGKTDPDSVTATWERMPRPLQLATGSFRFSPTDHNGIGPSDVHLAVDRNEVWFNL